MDIVSFIACLVDVVDFATGCVVVCDTPGGIFDVTVTIVFIIIDHMGNY
jgi:hypothetical protein